MSCPRVAHRRQPTFSGPPRRCTLGMELEVLGNGSALQNNGSQCRGRAVFCEIATIHHSSVEQRLLERRRQRRGERLGVAA